MFLFSFFYISAIFIIAVWCGRQQHNFPSGTIKVSSIDQSINQSMDGLSPVKINEKKVISTQKLYCTANLQVQVTYPCFWHLKSVNTVCNTCILVPSPSISNISHYSSRSLAYRPFQHTVYYPGSQWHLHFIYWSSGSLKVREEGL